MDSPIVQRLEEGQYQCRPGSSLVDMRLRPEVLIFVAMDLYVLPDAFARLNLLASGAYRVRMLYFKANVRERR